MDARAASAENMSFTSPPPGHWKTPGRFGARPPAGNYHAEEPFGVELYPTDQTTNNIKYTGQEEDACTGNLNLNFRMYQDAIGRFLRPDCYAGDPSQPQSWNRYSYVMGDPVNYIDPDGHYPTAIGGGFWGSTLGGLIAETPQSAFEWADKTGQMSTTAAVVFSGITQGETHSTAKDSFGLEWIPG